MIHDVAFLILPVVTIIMNSSIVKYTPTTNQVHADSWLNKSIKVSYLNYKLLIELELYSIAAYLDITILFFVSFNFDVNMFTPFY